MARACELTGIRPLTGNKVSHSNIKTKTRQMPNLMRKRYHIPELSRSVSLVLSTRAIRTIDHFASFSSALLKANDTLMSERLRGLKRQLKKQLANSAAKKSKQATKKPSDQVEAN